MAALGDDCYFFFTTTCAKGDACAFRHVESAKMNPTICMNWQMGGCYKPMCRFRHSTFDMVPIVEKTEVPCFWETQPSGCTKVNCAFKHVKSSAKDANIDAKTDPTTVPSIQVSSSVSNKFAAPQVSPVIIQPAESEESNSSPVKKLTNPNTVIEKCPSKDAVKDLQTSFVSKLDGFEKELSKDNLKATVGEKTDVTLLEKNKIKKKIAGSGVKNLKNKKIKEGHIKKPSKGKEGFPIKSKKPKLKTEPQKKVFAKVPPCPSVKDRLGSVMSKKTISHPQQKEKSSTESNDSVSDDSIENIKVESMEEIFRRKALESMMKRRAEAGKELLPSRKPSESLVERNKSAKKSIKKVQQVKLSRKQELEESSSSEEEEEEENSSAPSSVASNSTDTSSNSSEQSDSDDYEPDVRRVVVDVDSEKAARKRAKASLLARRKSQAQLTHDIIHKRIDGKVTKSSKKGSQLTTDALESLGKKVKKDKKRLINMDYELHDVFSSCPKKLSVRNRLGTSTRSIVRAEDDSSVSISSKASRVVEASDSVALLAGEAPPRKSRFKTQVQPMASDEDSNSMEDVKIKTLEEIRQEKMKKLAADSPSPEKQQIQAYETNDGEGNRQVIVIDQKVIFENDQVLTLTEEHKKPKRRPWRTQKLTKDDGEDERTAVIVEPASAPTKVELRSKDYDSGGLEESPFHQLKRKALLKKMASKKLKKASEIEGNDKEIEQDTAIADNLEHDISTVTQDVDEAYEEDVIESKKSKSRKHKHKHKHKKSKKEREIYMPPALQKSVAMVKPTQVCTPETKDVEPTIEVPDLTVAVKPGTKKRIHPIAAAWTAGLTASSKSTVLRPEMKVAAMPARKMFSEPIIPPPAKNNRLGIVNIDKPAATSSAPGTSELPIKSFSEIMAEKRRRRLELQAQKDALKSDKEVTPQAVNSSTSKSSSSVPPTIEGDVAKPFNRNTGKSQMPIIPIIFDKGPVSRVPTDDVQPTISPPHGSTDVTVNNRDAALSMNSVSPADEIVKTELGIKKKKLFKKTVEKKGSSTALSLAPSNNTPAVYSQLQSSKEHLPKSLISLDMGHDISISISDISSNKGSFLSITEEPCENKPTSSNSVSVKHKSPTPEAEADVKKSRLSIDDEFGLLGDEFVADDNVLAVDEDIDDLLQDIDDLLA